MLAVLAVHHLAGAAFHLGPRLAAIAEPRAYERARFPDQVALAEMVEGGRGVVAIPKGAALWMPRPVYLLHWERNGELFFNRVRGRHTPALQVLDRSSFTPAFLGDDSSHVGLAEHGIVDVSG